MPRPLLLWGPPASGKTTLAPRLAGALGVAHLDLDALVAARAGATPAELITARGEAAFRALEAEALRAALEGSVGVLSLGGGALLDPRLRREVLRRCTVATLTAPDAELLARMATGPARPLVTAAPDPAAALATLRALRAPAYAEAHVVVDTARAAPDAMVAELVALHARAPLAVPLGERTHRVEVAPLADARGSFEALGRDGVRVTDRNVARALRGRASKHLGPCRREVMLAPGEHHKSLASARRVWDALLAEGADRAWHLTAFGGGVVSDLAGFAAATFLRGVRWAAVPTTLLAMVDASVGGKTAVNHPRGKNLLGAFHHPSLVWIDPGLAATLAPREWRSGMAEVVKVALTRDAALLDLVEAHAAALRDPPPRDDPHAALRAEVVRRAVQAKIDVVADDERESGLRAVLNFGHTVGHAVEHASGYRLRHGEAVAVGMAAALELGVRRGLTAPSLRDRAVALLGALGLPTRARVKRDDAERALRGDKKRAGEGVRYVFATGAGAARIERVTWDEVAPALDAAVGVSAAS